MRIGIDIGGTKTDSVVVDAGGAVLHRYRATTGKGAAEVVAGALAAVDHLCRAAGITVEQAHAIGVGIPGAVERGVVRHAMNLGLTELDLAGALREAWGVAPAIENDVNAAALGAWTLSDGACESLAYLNVGTGLAAGIILNGALWRGARGAAGEIGHISVDPAGPPDMDGLPGGLETFASGSGVVRQWGDREVAASDVMARATAGDPHATAIRDNVVFGIATAVRVLILTLDVDEVVVGGGLTTMGEPLMTDVKARLAAWGHASAFLGSLDLPGRVRMLATDAPVAAIGAAMMGSPRG